MIGAVNILEASSLCPRHLEMGLEPRLLFRGPAPGARRLARLFAAPIGKWQVVSAGGEDTSRRLCAFQLKYLNIELQGWFWRLVAIIPFVSAHLPPPDHTAVRPAVPGVVRVTACPRELPSFSQGRLEGAEADINFEKAAG